MHKVHGTATRERKYIVSFSMGVRREARASVMKLKSRQSRDVLLRWRIYTPRRASFKDSRAASDSRARLHASRIHSCVHTPSKGECGHGTRMHYVILNSVLMRLTTRRVEFINSRSRRSLQLRPLRNGLFFYQKRYPAQKRYDIQT